MEKARRTLGVPWNATQAVIKRAYYKLALKTHPDKNAAPDAADQFRELQEAYALLSVEPEEPWFDSASILDALASSVSDETLLAIYKFLHEFKELIPEHDYLLQLLETRLSRPHISVEPDLNALFDQKVFIYTHENGKKYTIPLWHHTLVFDDLVVVCTPKTESEDVWVDESNDVHVTVQWKAQHLLENGDAVVSVGPKQFRVKASELRLMPVQTYVFSNQGVPRVHPDAILDVGRLSDVRVHVHLT